jgi:hypothetical protein
MSECGKWALVGDVVAVGTRAAWLPGSWFLVLDIHSGVASLASERGENRIFHGFYQQQLGRSLRSPFTFI